MLANAEFEALMLVSDMTQWVELQPKWAAGVWFGKTQSDVSCEGAWNRAPLEIARTTGAEPDDGAAAHMIVFVR